MDGSGNRGELVAIDLFSGAGGFSLGMQMVDGIRVVGAIDFDEHAVETYRANLEHPIIRGDITQIDAEKFAYLAGFHDTKVDVVFGGPPCQGFSTAMPHRNHGKTVSHDPRRDLYKPFLEYVKHFEPKIFVMENVRGITKANKGDTYKAIKAEAEQIGYIVHEEPLRAWQFGVPQKRIRHLIVGVRNGITPIAEGTQWVKPTHANLDDDVQDKNLRPAVTLGEAIGDLPHLEHGKSADKYDLKLRKEALARYGTRYLENVLGVSQMKVLEGHTARRHNERDLHDFGLLGQGETSADLMRRGEVMANPYNKAIFKDRYTRQHSGRLSSTIVAHLSKDGLMFIHPTQERSFTPREAARIQSFPDWFKFNCARTHQFRLIGNAVPPLMGQAIGTAVKQHLNNKP